MPIPETLMGSRSSRADRGTTRNMKSRGISKCSERTIAKETKTVTNQPAKLKTSMAANRPGFFLKSGRPLKKDSKLTLSVFLSFFGIKKL